MFPNVLQIDQPTDRQTDLGIKAPSWILKRIQDVQHEQNETSFFAMNNKF